MKKIISFASDFGLNDGSVGVVKGVINRVDPEIKVNDISHGIPAQNIKYGSLLLMRAIQYIPQGVLLAVVDPGVGTERNPIAITTDWGVMIGPDNGLLNLACATVGGAKQAFALENEDWIIPHEGKTFHARDIFSPFAAAYASNQLKIEEFGKELNLEDLKQYLIPLTDISDKEIKGEVLYVDHFGNCQTNISPEELKEKNFQVGDVINLTIDNQELKVKWCEAYENDNERDIGIVVDSWGMVSFFVSNGNASQLLDCKDSSKVKIKIENSKLKVR
jgi:S-adenosylmethionine hydrolase